MRSVPVRSLTVMVSAPPRALKSIPSTSLRSIVTLATSRVNRTRSPLAEMSIFSFDVGAVEEHRVEAVLALDGVAAVARVPDEGVVAGAHQRHVVAAAAVDEVVPLAADEDVVAGAAVEGQADRIRLAAHSRRRVVAAEGVDREPVARRLAPRDVHRGGQARDRRRRVAEPATAIAVRAVGAVDDDGVGRAVARAGPAGVGQVEVDLGDVGAGQVVDGDGVGAAQGVEVDLLDVVEVHGDVGRRRG